MGKWRIRPPITDQVEGNTCWAHALESWLKVTAGVAFETAGELIQKFYTLGCVTRSGALSPSKAVSHLWLMYRLRHEVIYDSNKFTSDYLQSKLRHSHVLLVFTDDALDEDGPALSHTVVVYGADKFSFCAMDPLAHPNTLLPGALWCKTFKVFKTGKTILHVLWRQV